MPEFVARPTSDPEQPKYQNGKKYHQARGADKPEFLRGNRENGIIKRSGKIAHLARRLAVAHAPDASRTDGDHRLISLIACPLQVAAWIQKIKNALKPVGRPPDDQAETDRADKTDESDVLEGYAAHEIHNESGRDENDHGARRRL